MKNEFELHPDRLGTSDEKGRRVFLHPADVSGFFRRWRTRTQWVLILFFLTLPWIKVNGKQAVLLNIADRHFEIFGLSLRAHNSPLLILVLLAAAFALLFVTAVFGRVWCGWACPQTVFIDGVFRKIERWVEGTALERRRLDQAGWSFKKLGKKAAKWIAFTSFSLILTHSFLAYFVGTEKLAEMIRSSPTENWGDFVFMITATAVILFDFGWFREQFCTIVCPYGRFQSVVMDKASLIVAYDSNRGEPRSTPQTKALIKNHGGNLGDCVNCYRCVQVCPTGIDIRRGLQMECIACTACIDACDDVMTKLKKPTGLIRYDSMIPKEKRRRRLGVRAISYLTLCIGSFVALIFFTRQIQPIDFQVLRSKGALYTSLAQSDGSTVVINHFKIELSNQYDEPRRLTIGVIKDLSAPAELITAFQPYTMTERSVDQMDVFIRFPSKNLVNGQARIRIYIKDSDPNAETSPFYSEKEITLVGPFS